MSGKKKHTAYCTSKAEETITQDDWSGGGAGAAAGWVPGQCANPDCWYMKNSDPTISAEYCCEKCEGTHQGQDWAEGGKKHWKSCEKIEVGSREAQQAAQQGAWGGGKGGCGKGDLMAQMMQMMGWGMGDGWMGGMGDAMMGDAWGCGKTCGGKGDSWGGGKTQKGPSGGGGVIKTLYEKPRGGGMMGGKGKDKGNFGGKAKSPLANFPAEQKVWVGNLGEACDIEALKEHFKLCGEPQVALLMGRGTAGVAFASSIEAEQAIALLNGSELNGQVLQVDVWTGK